MSNIQLSFNSKYTNFEKHFIIAEEKQTTISALQLNISKLSKNKLKLAMKYGAVWLTSENRKTVRVRKAKKLLNIGDKLSIYYDEEILFSDIKPAKLITDEGDYSIWNKPKGMFSQGTKWGDHNSIARWVELFGFENYDITTKPTFIVHRLDRATSGLIVVSHSKKATQLLTKIFENRMVDKKYQAVVNGEFPLADIPRTINEKIDGRIALTQILSTKFNQIKKESTLIVKIKTGRKHQIRKHLASIEFPIIGDRLYGNKTELIKMEYQQPDLMLTSFYLSFICPFTKTKREYII